MFPQDFIVHLRNIWNRGAKRTEQEEKPSVIVVDNATWAGHKVTFLCYPDNDGALATTASWKVKMIDETTASGLTETKYYIDKNYNKIINGGVGIPAQMIIFYNLTSNWIYPKDI